MARPSDVQVLEIQAAVLRNKGGPLKIESLELEGPRDDEVLVGIVATGICHTDIDFYDDWDGAAEPVGQKGDVRELLIYFDWCVMKCPCHANLV